MPFHPGIVSGLATLADGASVFGTGLAVYMLYVGWQGHSLPLYLSFLTLDTLFVLAAFGLAGLYHFESLSHPERQLHKIFMICGLSFMIMTVLAFALKISEEFSRVWAFAWFFAATAGICLVRVFGHAQLSEWAVKGRLTRNVAVVGAGIQGQRLVEALQASEDPWLNVIGVFDDRTTRVPSEVGKVPVIGGLGQLVDFVRQNRIDDIVIALPWSAESRQLGIVEKLSLLPAHVQLAPDMIGFHFPVSRYDRLGAVSCLKVSARPLDGWSAVLKAVEDWLVASVILFAVLPLMLMIAAAIKLGSRGPVFYRQERYGFNNQLIEVFKFRTMYDDPDPDPEVLQARRNDPRVTRVGAFLRRTSLDELPQLLNVLRGEMSVVGPRPHAVAHDEKYGRVIDRYLGRFRVRPGITGWAQVNGWRGETDTLAKMRARIEHDLSYIESWSVALDLRILLWTVGIVVRGRNAY